MSPNDCKTFLDEVFADLLASRTTTREAAERMHNLIKLEEEQKTWKAQQYEQESVFSGRFYL